MAEISYEKLALDWHPGGRNERKFHVLVAVVVAAMLSLGIVLSLIKVPEQDRRERSEVPDRVARFIEQQERPRVEPPPPPPRPEPPPPPPVIEEVQRVERERPTEVQEPVTAEEREARDVAERSGLLALRDEMSGLFDSAADVRGSLAGNLPQDSGDTQAVAGHDASVITQGAVAGSGGVDTSLYNTGIGSSRLADREVAEVDDSLLAEAEPASPSGTGRETRRAADGRLQEDVTVVFDQHKGSLYSLYERERRRTPGLQGIVVVEISIASNGEVTDVKIISSELNNPSLEARLVARIRGFIFGDKDVPPVTVTFPIEFLPS